jgi:hypothetical protein
MTDDLIKITKDVVNKYSKMSVEELLKLPEPVGYEFVDDIYDQIVASRNQVQEPSSVVRVDLDYNLMSNINNNKIGSKLASSIVDEQSNTILIKEGNYDNVFSSSEEDFSWVA